MANAPDSKRSDWDTYRRLIAYSRPYLWRLIVGALCGVLFAGSTVGLLPVIQDALGRFFDPDQPLDMRMAAMIGGGIILLMLVRGVGQFYNAYLVQWVGNRVVMDMRVGTFAHLQDLSVGFFTATKTGEMISRTVNDSTLLERAVSNVLTDVVRQPIVLVGTVAYAVTRDWRLALSCLVLFPLCMLPVLVFGRKVRRSAREGQEHLAEIVSIMQEAISGVRIVKAFCMEEREQTRFALQCTNFFRRVMRVVKSKALIEPIIVLISGFGLVFALAYAAHSEMPWNEFITLAIALVVLYDPVKRLSKIHLSIQQSSAAADRIFEILDTEVSVSDAEDASTFEGPIESICFDHVGFTYGEADVLNDIVLDVKAGERIALVGGSGAGKTTLVNLLPRFFDVTSGAIRVNGVDVRDMTLRSLRLQMGLVTQDTFLFNDTVASNIAYGCPDATQEAIETAARSAHAHDFVLEMPEGYNTMVGEMGVRLSGGQRQRLAIARAILNNPTVLILDEATSALDTESERIVQSALDALVKGRTVFAIAHRLSTIKNCNRIVVMDKGEIVEIGTHDDLLASGGAYKRLHDMQFDR
ncbi:MAG: ABC transporter ATP-binding protein [Verrucomicrobia bacterium]|jgi:ATP-binding cassette, subfamily B, bacterial MsbA|nr:ABC transporter ATP-binding protein [Verrucomicrobiota bacterium]